MAREANSQSHIGHTYSYALQTDAGNVELHSLLRL